VHRETAPHNNAHAAASIKTNSRENKHHNPSPHPTLADKQQATTHSAASLIATQHNTLLLAVQLECIAKQCTRCSQHKNKPQERTSTTNLHKSLDDLRLWWRSIVIPPGRHKFVALHNAQRAQNVTAHAHNVTACTAQQCTRAVSIKTNSRENKHHKPSPHPTLADKQQQ
jgi:hypothetical protein